MSQLSVLIIDDDRDVGDMLRETLAFEGHRAVHCTTAEQALDLIRHDDPGFHVVVLDLLLHGPPGTGPSGTGPTGLDLLPKIRELDDDIAVIILTGYPSVETASASISHEISAYLSKPYEAEALREALARIARKKGLVTRNEAALLQAIGHNIRELRKKRGLTLRQLAKRTGLSVSLLSQIEREPPASISSLYKIATALDVKLTALFGDF